MSTRDSVWHGKPDSKFRFTSRRASKSHLSQYSSLRFIAGFDIVDFTASWCLSCQVNERAVLHQPQIQRAFQEANVVSLRADWTRHDEAITHALTMLGRSGVPAYVLYIPGQKTPELLPEVLTPGIVTDALIKLPKTQEKDSVADLRGQKALAKPN